MIAVDIKTNGSTFEAGTPKTLFDSEYVNRPHSTSFHAYAVAPDGQRFLIPRPLSNVTDTSSQPIIVVMNWATGVLK